MTKDEALKLALEALELALSSHGVMLLSDPPQDPWKTKGVESKSRQAIIAIKEALAQPAQEEQPTKEDLRAIIERKIHTIELYRKELRKLQTAAQPAQEPFDTHASPGQAFDTHSRKPAQEITFTTGHCPNKAQPGGCQLHNLQCGYPTCDRWPVVKPADRKPVVPNHDEVRDLVIELKTLIEDIESRLT